MSNSSSGQLKFKCWFDHGLGVPCDGHTLEIIQHHTSDTVSVVIDGENRLIVDEGTWQALNEAIDALKARSV